MNLPTGLGRLNGPVELPTKVNDTSRSARSTTTRTTPAGERAEDAATISSTSTLVAKALATTDVRLDKVEALRRSIAEGSYEVSSSELASKIVDLLRS